MNESANPKMAGGRYSGRYKTIMDVMEDVDMEEAKVEKAAGGGAEDGDGGAAGGEREAGDDGAQVDGLQLKRRRKMAKEMERQACGRCGRR